MAPRKPPKGCIVMEPYLSFCRLKLDTSPLGLERGAEDTLYFCTPRDARLFGRAGVDGIHFCFIQDMGEMVFAVSPSNLPGDNVHPLADSFADFLRLLLACGNTAPLEQAHGWDRAQFDRFLAENPVSAEASALLGIIGKELHLTPMEDPFGYLKTLQADFDYSRLSFSEEYEELLPQEETPPADSAWAVYFDGNFWGHEPRQRPGTALPINVEFTLREQLWRVPAVYDCAKGIVVDLCVRVDPAVVRSFIDKWELSLENDGHRLSEAQRMQSEMENPLSLSISPTLTVNGMVLSNPCGCSFGWNPCFPDHNDQQAKAVLAHYGLDPAWGWLVYRYAFSWVTARKPRLSSLSLTIQFDPVEVPGPTFSALEPGKQVSFTHPVTQEDHTLTVQEYEQQVLDPARFRDDDFDYPTHYTAMSYTVYPNLPDGDFSLWDAQEGDQPQRKATATGGALSCSVGLIGRMSADTPVLFGGPEQGRVRATCSAMRFQPTDEVEWQVVFRQKPYEDFTTKIM